MRKVNKKRGGVALEYILVSTFAAILTSIILGVMANVAKKKITKLAEKMDVPIEDVSWSAILE